MRSRTAVLAAMLAMAPLGARAADLVVWWEEGLYAEEDAAVREIIAAFEQKTGKKVELVLPSARGACRRSSWRRSRPGSRPTSLFRSADRQLLSPQWAHEDRLVDLTDASAPADLFDPDALSRVTLLDATTGRRGLYALPMGRTTNHVHVWKSLLERAGFTLADIPKEWDRSGPSGATRSSRPAPGTGRDDIWGVGLRCRPTRRHGERVLAVRAMPTRRTT